MKEPIQIIDSILKFDETIIQKKIWKLFRIWNSMFDEDKKKYQSRFYIVF